MSALEVTGAPATPPAPAADLAVEVRDLHKRYGKFVALDGMDLTIPNGSIFGLIGPNGAGKTTTFAILASLLKPTSGSVAVLGLDPARHAREVRKVMGYMPDGLGVYSDLDVDEYLRFFAASYRVPKASWDDLLEGLLELVGLRAKREARVDSLSRGMKQRLSLARALLHDPTLLILDEPASGLDPRARAELRTLLLQLATMGKTIVISSHILSELEDVCTDIAIMQAGKVLTSGPASEISGRLAGGRRLRARFADGSSEEHDVADEAEQAALLRSLATDDQRVLVEFVRLGGGLEELFLTLTEDADR